MSDEDEDYVLPVPARMRPSATLPEMPAYDEDVAAFWADDAPGDAPPRPEAQACAGGSPTACAYCGLDDAAATAQCADCGQWFCNGTGHRAADAGAAGTHIVQHLVRAQHTAVAPSAAGPLADSAPLECFHCGNRNVFLLGFIPARADALVVLLCRTPCAAGGSRDPTWDTGAWAPLISGRALLPWIAPFPDPDALAACAPISARTIAAVEAARRAHPEHALASLVAMARRGEALPGDAAAAGGDLRPTQLRYASAAEYASVFAPLVAAEAEQDRLLCAAQTQRALPVVWERGEKGLVARFALPPAADGGARIAPGDEVVISAGAWRTSGTVVSLPAGPGAPDVVVAVKAAPRAPDAPCDVELVWRATPYDRMHEALRTFALADAPKWAGAHISAALRDAIVGRGAPHETPAEPAALLDAPGLPALNASQRDAVRAALSRPLSLVQGPPGTGKTVTSAAIVYRLATGAGAGPVLVVASSNVAVDHLAEKIHATGLRVVRVVARSREAEESPVAFLSLSAQALAVGCRTRPALRRLAQLRADAGGDLAPADARELLRHMAAAEDDVLAAAQVVATTSSSAGCHRLRGARFSAVLFDEASQAPEPEALVPLLHGAERLVMVGDHRQLGPMVACRAAQRAGLALSLFERMIALGHRPHRLDVQYRMHPVLSALPSALFYDGALQDGVTAAQRAAPGLDFPWPRGADTPTYFHAVAGCEEIAASGTSFLNRAEAAIVERTVARLLRAGVSPRAIGIITPYDGQRAFLVSHLASGGSLPAAAYAGIEVASVDAFQGREKDYVVVSCVRASDLGGIGFLGDARRLNVALTRARLGLVVVGNPRALARNTMWHALLVHYRRLGVLVEGPLGALRPCHVHLGRPRQAAPMFLRDNGWARPAAPAPVDLSAAVASLSVSP